MRQILILPLYCLSILFFSCERSIFLSVLPSAVATPHFFRRAPSARAISFLLFFFGARLRRALLSFSALFPACRASYARGAVSGEYFFRRVRRLEFRAPAAFQSKRKGTRVSLVFPMETVTSQILLRGSDSMKSCVTRFWKWPLI